MKIKIIVFTPEKSYSFIKKSLENLDENVQYIFYQELENLVELYHNFASKADAIITSGPLGYEKIKNNAKLSTPIYFFELKKYEIYKNLLDITLKNPKIDFSKTYIDFIGFFEKDRFFEDVSFPDNKPPIIFDIDLNDSNFYKKIKEKYLNLLEENKVDFVFTRISNLIPFLEENNINYKFLFPSESSIKSKFLSITKDLKQLKYENRNIVIINLFISKNHEFIKKNIEKKFKNFIVQEHKNNLEIITLKNEFLLCNNGYDGYEIIRFLKNLLEEDLVVGFGSSYDIENARLLSKKSLNKSLTSNYENYYFFENEKIIILNNIIDIRKNFEFDASTSLLENLNFNNHNTKKLLVIAKENPQITSEKLSFLLNISKRTASRILNKLEENGLAISNDSKIPRGRPLKEYSFLF
ncbi:MAG: MarR family transcriptional regulator [Fusobacteriaceae bacterium]